MHKVDTEDIYREFYVPSRPHSLTKDMHPTSWIIQTLGISAKNVLFVKKTH